MRLCECWAKSDPFQSVVTHGLVSGKVAQILFAEAFSEGDRELLAKSTGILSEDLKAFLGYLVSLHDIGKIDYSFQVQNDRISEIIAREYSDEIFKPQMRHEKTGQMCLKYLWEERKEDRIAKHLFSKVIGSHHQGKTGPGSFIPGSAWQILQSEFENLMEKVFLGDRDRRLPEIIRNHQGIIGVLTLGLMILSDWISSGSLFSDAENWINSLEADKILSDRMKGFLSKSGFQPIRYDWPDDFCGIWPNIPPTGCRPLQKEIESLLHHTEKKISLVLLEAPMGEGKTEAGVYAAIQLASHWQKDGLYIALPTAATANQMVIRIREFLKMHTITETVRLLHSMAWLEVPLDEIDAPDEYDEILHWLTPVKRGLLSQFAIGTVDQAMLAATNVKYGVLRLIGLSNKVLIIDEIHSYDAYMSEIIVRLLEWCKALEIPVILMSATLPPEMKKKLLAPYSNHEFSGDYPLITMIDEDGAVTEHIVSGTVHKLEMQIKLIPALGENEMIADMAVCAVQDGGCICVLMNTVREAQEVYQAIREKFDGDKLLFHAQFPAERRTELEKECIARYGKDKTHRPERSILVATQVVEQSLDLDFDMMISSVAPIDLLIQRAGRVFRHQESPRPASHSFPLFVILTPAENKSFGVSSYVYPECFLKNSVRILKEVSKIRFPEDIAPLVRKGYSSEDIPEKEVEKWLEYKIREQVEAGASRQFLLNPPEKMYSGLDEALFYDDEESHSLSAKTRLGEPTVRIVLLSEREIERIAHMICKTEQGARLRVKSRKEAESLIKKSVSVRCSRLGEKQETETWITGEGLLAGTRIYRADNNMSCISNGKRIIIDHELGLLIKEVE